MLKDPMQSKLKEEIISMNYRLIQLIKLSECLKAKKSIGAITLLIEK